MTVHSIQPGVWCLHVPKVCPCHPCLTPKHFGRCRTVFTTWKQLSYRAKCLWDEVSAAKTHP